MNQLLYIKNFFGFFYYVEVYKTVLLFHGSPIATKKKNSEERFTQIIGILMELFKYMQS